MFNPNDFSELFQKSLQDPKLREQITDEEKSKFSKAFEDPKFQEIFAEFAQEMSTKEGRQDLEKQIQDAEKISEAQSLVQTIYEEHAPAQKVGVKQPKTAAYKVQYQKQYQGIYAMEKEIQRRKEAEKKYANQIQGLEYLYAQAMGKKVAPKNPPAVREQSSYPQAGITPEEMQKLEELVTEVDKMKAELHAENSEKEWRNELSYVQNVDYGDFIEQERVNVYKIRGDDKVKLEVGIPDDVDPKALQLEIQRDKIVLKSGSHVFEKQVKVKLLYKSGRATLQSGKKFGLQHILLIEVDIEKDPNAIFSDFRSYLNYPKQYETREIDEQEIEYLAERISTPQPVYEKESLIEVPSDVRQVSKGWREQTSTSSASPVLPVSYAPQSQSFESILKQYLEEKKKGEAMTIDAIEKDLREYEKTGVFFNLRGHRFHFCNLDLADELY